MMSVPSGGGRGDADEEEKEDEDDAEEEEAAAEKEVEKEVEPPRPATEAAKLPLDLIEAPKKLPAFREHRDDAAAAIRVDAIGGGS